MRIYKVAICHAASNAISIFVPTASTISSENMGSYIAYAMFEIAVAIVMTVIAGPARLSRTEPKQIQE